MKTVQLIKIITISACGLALVACSSTKHRGAGAAGIDGGAGGANGGAYAQGLGGEGGFQPATSCNVPTNSNAVFFAFDQSTVHAEDQSRLQSLGQNLVSTHQKVKLVGNTDDRGSREYNVALGWRRANSVASILRQNGASQIQTESNGAEKPIAYGQSEEDYQCNRRVDVQE